MPASRPPEPPPEPGPEPRSLPRWRSPYDHWAAALAPAPQGARELVVAAEVNRCAKVRPRLDRALAQGIARTDARGGGSGDEGDGYGGGDGGAMTLYLPADAADSVLESLGDEVDVWSAGRPVAVAGPPAPPSETASNSASPPAAAALRVAAPIVPPFPDVPVVAVIDDGIGWLNQRFCRRDPAAGLAAPLRTRFHAVWLQSFAPAPEGAQLAAGRVLRRAEIDAILAQGGRLEEAVEYRRIHAPIYGAALPRMAEQSASHGTHTLDLAAGADPWGDDPARHWPLLAVQLPPAAVDDTAGTALEPMLVRGVDWCLAEARALGGRGPVVINISYATFAGPKDGTKAVEARIARAVDRFQARTGRQARVVLSWGNARQTRQAARLVLAPRGVAAGLDWRLPPDDHTASYLEVRPDRPADLNRLSLALTPPGAGAPVQVIAPIPADTFVDVTDAAGRAVGQFARIGPRVTAPGVTTPAHAVLAMAPTEEDGPRPRAPHGAWGLAWSVTGARPCTLRLEVQRDDTPMGYRANGRQSTLDHPLVEEDDPETGGWGAPEAGCPITRAGTHSSFATSPSPCLIAVAAARADSLSPARYSAEGAAWTRAGPALAALADRGPARPGLVAAATFSGGGRMLDGSSAAAARATRALALHLSGPGPHPAAGPAEIAALVAGWGSPTAPADVARLGAGVLTDPAEPPRL